jgi:hypothetical protein
MPYNKISRKARLESLGGQSPWLIKMASKELKSSCLCSLKALMAFPFTIAGHRKAEECHNGSRADVVTLITSKQ